MQTQQHDKYTVYTDGSYYANYMGKEVGGWAFIVYRNDELKPCYVRSGKVKRGLNIGNNECELFAVYKAFEFMKKKRRSFTLKTDSKAVLDGLKGKTMPKFGLSLWEQLFALGRVNVQDAVLIPRKDNEEADYAAGMAARSFITR